MDSAAKYLRRVAEIRVKAFGSSGFLSAEPDSTSPSFTSSSNPENTPESAPKKRSRSPSCDPGTLVNTPSAHFTSETTPHTSVDVLHRTEFASTAPRVSLMEKWFPGNALKISTIEQSCSPSEEYVKVTTSKIIEMREKMLLLRNGVEDVENALKSFGVAEMIGEGIQEEVVANLRPLINQFSLQKSKSTSCAKLQLTEFLRVKHSLFVPTTANALRWHEFLNEKGPETPVFPFTSFFLFPSSASLTLLFTILIQRLQKRYRSNKEEQKSLTCDEYLTPPSVPTSNDDKNELSTKDSHLSALDSFESEQNLLIFLRLFMPVASLKETEPSSSPITSGYSTWLLACLTVLDTPLDPDTDRLASTLFHLCCDQVRVIGKLIKVTGDQRGSLADAILERKRPNSLCLKRYTSIEDVGYEELLGLYTIIIVLSKIFRQNQNKLIYL